VNFRKTIVMKFSETENDISRSPGDLFHKAAIMFWSVFKTLYDRIEWVRTIVHAVFWHQQKRH
jgi:hypothetical protein